MSRLSTAYDWYHLLEKTARVEKDIDSFQVSLGNQALILQARGDLDGAMDLLKEEECICRELDCVDSLQISLGNQANILYACGDLDGAMKLHKEEERICKEMGNVESLARSIANQSLILKQQEKINEAIAMVHEAHDLASRHGYTALTKWINELKN